MDRLLLSGAGGYLGHHLSSRLSAAWELYGVGRSARPESFSGEWLQKPDEVSGLAEAVAEIEPSLVVHSAFLNRPEAGEADDAYLGRLAATNSRVFDACARGDVGVVLVSSSAVYGSILAGHAANEECPRRPVSLYGVAKTLQEMLAEQAQLGAGLRLSVLRLFNLIGPGPATGTVLAEWMEQVRAVEEGGEPILHARTLGTSRDFVDVRDAARAVALVAETFVPGTVFNVASGRAVTMEQLSRELQALSAVPYSVVVRGRRPEDTDAAYQRGDASRIQASLGWAPEIGWRTSVRDAWAFSRQHAWR